MDSNAVKELDCIVSWNLKSLQHNNAHQENSPSHKL